MPDLIDLPAHADGRPIFQFNSIKLQDYQLQLSGTITNRPDLKPTQIQVWQSDYDVDLTSTCSTEQPLALIRPSTGSGSTYIPASTPYDWSYCIQGQSLNRTNQVPWLNAGSWSFQERRRKLITEPRVWDFRMSVDLDDPRVLKLEYRRPAGWTVVIWAGETMIAREWIPD